MVVFKFCVLLEFLKYYSKEEFLWCLRVVFLVMCFEVQFSFVIFVDQVKKDFRELEVEFFVELDLEIFLVFSLEFRRRVVKRNNFRELFCQKEVVVG